MEQKNFSSEQNGLTKQVESEKKIYETPQLTIVTTEQTAANPGFGIDGAGGMSPS